MLNRPLKGQLEISVGPSPYEWKARHPVLAIDRLPRSSMLRWLQNAGLRVKLRSSHLSPNRARRHAYLWIIANPLGLSQIAACHHIELAAFFPKPHGSSDARSGLTKRCERNVFLTLDRGGNLAWHKVHSKMPQNKSPRQDQFLVQTLSSLVRDSSRQIAPVAPYVLQA
jgi:hypothetical protein